MDSVQANRKGSFLALIARDKGSCSWNFRFNTALIDHAHVQTQRSATKNRHCNNSIKAKKKIIKATNLACFQASYKITANSIQPI